MAAEVSQEEQHECLPVFFLGNPAGGEERGEEEHERQLDQGEDLKQQQAKSREFGDTGRLPPAKGRLSGGVHQHEEGERIPGPQHKVPQ